MSNMYIFLDERNDNVHLQNCCKLGSVLSKYKGNTFCKNCLDEGHMYIVGIGKLCNGLVGRYKLTESDEVQEALKNLVKCSEDYYRCIGMNKLIDSLKLKQKKEVNVLYHQSHHHSTIETQLMLMLMMI